MMTKRLCSKSGQVWALGWTEISLSHQLSCLPCRGVRPDREQEVRGDSSQPVTDNKNVSHKHGALQWHGPNPQSREQGGNGLNSQFHLGPVLWVLVLDVFSEKEMHCIGLLLMTAKQNKKWCVGGVDSSVWSGHKSGVYLSHSFLDMKRRTNVQVYL